MASPFQTSNTESPVDEGGEPSGTAEKQEYWWINFGMDEE